MARAMKDSGIEWIREIPEGWKVDSIKRHFSVIAGATPKSESSEFWDGDIPWITPADYKTRDKFVSGGKRNLTQAGYDSCGTTLIPRGSIVFSKRAPVGTVAIANNELCTNQGCLSCVVKDGSVPSYYYYAMSVFTEQFELVSTGTTFKEIAADVFANFRLPAPSITEQQRIADYLDAECSRIDAVIEQTRESIEEYKKLKQSVITEAVTKGIRPGRKMKDSGVEWIGKIPEDWEQRKLKSFISIPVVDGPHESPVLYDTGIPYISATAIVNGIIDFSLRRGFISEEYCNECDKRYKPQVGDILVIKLGASTGQVAIVDSEERFNIWVPLAAVRCSNLVISKFIYYCFQSDYLIRQMELSWTFGTQQTLGIKTIEALKFFIPPIEEQEKIIEHLNKKCYEINSLLEKKQQLLGELESYKRSLIFEYVTGKKEA